MSNAPYWGGGYSVFGSVPGGYYGYGRGPRELPRPPRRKVSHEQKQRALAEQYPGVPWYAFKV